MRFIAPIPDAIFLDKAPTWFSHVRFSSISTLRPLLRDLEHSFNLIMLFIFKEDREGRLLRFCLEPINMNSVLVIFIYVEQVFVQGRLNGVNITIRISHMSLEILKCYFKKTLKDRKVL